MVDLFSMFTPNLLGDAEARTIGERFVRQYYRKLQETPHLLHRQYQNIARLSHISEKPGIYVSGQLAIKMFFKELHLKNCIAKIAQVDSHATVERGVVVQVCGKLSTNGQPMRCFMQTFVLARKYAMNYFIVNDIFRYMNEVFDDESGPEGEEPEETAEEKASENGGEDEPVHIQSVEEKQSEQEGEPVNNGAGQSAPFVPASRRHVKPSRPAEEKPASKRKVNRSPQGDSFAGRLGRSPGSRHPDSHQLFVGNIPHHISENDLKAFFQRWGNVMGVKINTKNKDSKLPYFGFVAFESATPVQNVLKEKPVRFDGGYRLNVEEKTTRSGGSRGGGPRSGIGGHGGHGRPHDGYRRGRGGNTRW
ncbi:hypothetical protein ACOMHN_002405 [Nucella lapillus]